MRAYETLTGSATQESGFRKKARQVVPVLHELLRRRLSGLAQSAATPELRGRLASLRDVLIPNALAGVYDGTDQPAELKMHAVCTSEFE